MADEKKELTQMLAQVDADLARIFKAKLKHEGLTYREWLEVRMRDYTKRTRLVEGK